MAVQLVINAADVNDDAEFVFDTDVVRIVNETPIKRSRISSVARYQGVNAVEWLGREADTLTLDCEYYGTANNPIRQLEAWHDAGATVQVNAKDWTITNIAGAYRIWRGTRFYARGYTIELTETA